jgi:hypothetical protein
MGEPILRLRSDFSRRLRWFASGSQPRKNPQPRCDIQPCGAPRSCAIRASRLGYGEPDRNAHNSFVLKILTSKFFDIKILQTLLCRTRAPQDFRRVRGEGGTPGFRLQPEQNIQSMKHGGTLFQPKINTLCRADRRKFLRRLAKSMAEWPRGSWSLGGVVCPTERPAWFFFSL